MSERIIMMPDKILRSGMSPVYDDKENIIAKINYQYWSFSRKLEITDYNDNIISCGKIKLFTLMPTWMIFDSSNNKIGMIKRLFNPFSRSYIYTNTKGVTYKIEGNIFKRSFKVFENDNTIIDVSCYSELITIRPHSYLVRILDENLDTYEVINIVEGIRNLVELAKSRH